MFDDLSTEIDERGFASIEKVINDDQIIKLIECVLRINLIDSDTEKRESVYGVRNLLNLSPETNKLTRCREVRTIIENVLGVKARPVRAIFFDKTPEANWKVPWHQDLTIAVKQKRETDGFTAWTRKAGIQHVQPPVSLLENMLAIRIHLDDSDETNGVLKVIPNSHKNGRLSAEEIKNLRTKINAKVCNSKRGEAFLMRPLLVHSSSSGTRPKNRRVIHIEFASQDLPDGLEWYGS